MNFSAVMSEIFSSRCALQYVPALSFAGLNEEHIAKRKKKLSYDLISYLL